jgi:hypothetical protein
LSDHNRNKYVLPEVSPLIILKPLPEVFTTMQVMPAPALGQACS